MTRIQFILKHRNNSYACDPEYSDTYFSSGLYNSARLVQEMLRDLLGYETSIVHAVDNNSIDKLVTHYKPDIVIIEAYWVVPEKFDILVKLHPKIKWVVRNHSPMPFAANESVIVDWSLRYMDHPNVILACNDDRTDRDFRRLIGVYKLDWEAEQINERCVFLPNYYPVHYHQREVPQQSDIINIGCFGAIRPLKNQLIQAVASIEYADEVGKTLRFHINGTRVEGRGDAILHNIRSLFRNIKQHELVEHSWLTHDEFITLIRTMDIGLQVSYSESFNIVSADLIVNGVPVVVSPEIRWMDHHFHADPNNSSSIVEAIEYAVRANRSPHLINESLNNLHHHDEDSVNRWQRFITQVE
jgi:hypothetical protein